MAKYVETWVPAETDHLKGREGQRGLGKRKGYLTYPP